MCRAATGTPRGTLQRGSTPPACTHAPSPPLPPAPRTQLGGDAGDPSQKASWTTIKATTVDDFASASGLLSRDPRRALLLKIDTEGFDPAVLQGARRLLSLQVPSVVLFEYHNKQAWAATSLRDVAFNLAASGYACYFDGDPTLTRISGCWHDSLEIKNWCAAAARSTLAGAPRRAAPRGRHRRSRAHA